MCAFASCFICHLWFMFFICVFVFYLFYAFIFLIWEGEETYKEQERKHTGKAQDKCRTSIYKNTCMFSHFIIFSYCLLLNVLIYLPFLGTIPGRWTGGHTACCADNDRTGTVCKLPVRSLDVPAQAVSLLQSLPPSTRLAVHLPGPSPRGGLQKRGIRKLIRKSI